MVTENLRMDSMKIQLDKSNGQYYTSNSESFRKRKSYVWSPYKEKVVIHECRQFGIPSLDLHIVDTVSIKLFILCKHLSPEQLILSN